MTEPIETLTKSVLKTGEKGFLDLIDSFFGGFVTINKARSLAKGEVEAEKIKMDWELKDKIVYEQALKLKALELTEEYTNLGNVIQKTLPKLSETESSETKNKDNLKLLFDEAKTVSDDEMQEYIAKILAGEYNQPGSISRQTIRTVQSMTKKDFQLFEKYASLIWDDFYLRAYFNEDKRYKLKDIMILEDLGLFDSFFRGISINAFDSYDITTFINLSKKYYFNIKKNCQLNDIYRLTTSGQELLKFVNPKPDEKYIKWSLEWFEKQGLKNLESSTGI